MEIENLGPVKNADVSLGNLTVFVGNNGTGKTLTAYAIYAFFKWFKKDYKFILLKEDELLNLVKSNTKLKLNLQEFMEKTYEDISDKFNALNNDYFKSAFNDDNFLNESSNITVTSNDVKLLLRDSKELGSMHFGITWGYSENSRDEENVTNKKNRVGYHFDFDNNQINIEYGLYDFSENEPEKLAGESDPFSKVSVDKITEFFNTNVKMRIFANSFTYLPAERIGINTFINELIDARGSQSFMPDDIDHANSVNIYNEHYPTAIEDYIVFVSQHIKDEKSLKRKAYNNESTEMLKKLLPGEFKYDRDKSKLNYTINDSTVGFDLVSSSIKSIFGLDIFVKQAEAGDWLIIDEPEMNLHPQRQRIVINLLYRLAKNGMKIVMSTHSDYLIKELVNLRIEDYLESNNGKNLTKDIQDDVRIYQFKSNEVIEIRGLLTQEEDLSNFDTTTNEINDKYYDLLGRLD